MRYFREKEKEENKIEEREYKIYKKVEDLPFSLFAYTYTYLYPMPIN